MVKPFWSEKDGGGKGGWHIDVTIAHYESRDVLLSRSSAKRISSDNHKNMSCGIKQSLPPPSLLRR